MPQHQDPPAAYLNMVNPPIDSNRFFELAGRYPLLTTNEEISLGRQIQQWLQDPDPSPRVARMGRKARERFVLCNLRLVIAVAKKYRSRLSDSLLTFDDILQEGVVGLQRAAEKYDPECGYKMSTYAYWWIKQRINRALMMHAGLIKIPLGARNKYKQYLEASEQAGPPTEILERAGLSLRDLKTVERVDLCRKVVCMDALDLDMI